MTNLRKRGHETVNYFLVFNNYGSDNLDNTIEYQWLSRDFVIVLSTKRSVICVEDRIVLKQVEVNLQGGSNRPIFLSFCRLTVTGNYLTMVTGILSQCLHLFSTDLNFSEYFSKYEDVPQCVN